MSYRHPVHTITPNPLTTGSPATEDSGLHTYGYDASLLSWPAPEVSKKFESSCVGQYLSFFIKRLRIAVQALPGTLLLLLLRYLLWGEEKFPDHITIIDSTVVPPMIACMSFIMGLVLSNVISDYKESEKVPSELVAYFREFCPPLFLLACHSTNTQRAPQMTSHPQSTHLFPNFTFFSFCRNSYELCLHRGRGPRV